MWITGEARPEILADRLDWFPEDATASLVIGLPRYFRKVLDE
jgi:hypothetical protein